jgi:hypothetical protein
MRSAARLVSRLFLRSILFLRSLLVRASLSHVDSVACTLQAIRALDITISE